MEKITLERLETSDQGTFGRMIINDELFYTGELPWRNNKNNISCIPAGIYICKWTMSPHFKREMYLIENVKGRAGIRIHAANFVGDKALRFRCQLNGCIAIGERVVEMAGQKALIISSPAVRRFEELMNYKSFILEIVDGTN